MTTKTCTKCGKEKPATEEYFSVGSKYKNGIRGECKLCMAEYQAAYRLANRERIKSIKRANHESNRERNNRRAREWHENNKDRVARRKRAFKEANREVIKERLRKWHSANPNWRRAAENRRRARKLSAGGCYTTIDVQQQYDAQKGQCYYCKCQVGDSYHVDHAIPLSRGGSNGPENIVIACQPCNQSKGAKLPHEWVQGGRLL